MFWAPSAHVFYPEWQPLAAIASEPRRHSWWQITDIVGRFFHKKQSPHHMGQGIVATGTARSAVTSGWAALPCSPSRQAGSAASGALAQGLMLGGAVDHRLQGGVDHIATDGDATHPGALDAQQHIGGGAGFGAGGERML